MPVRRPSLERLATIPLALLGLVFLVGVGADYFQVASGIAQQAKILAGLIIITAGAGALIWSLVFWRPDD